MATVPDTSGQNGVPLPANTAPLTALISSAGISGSNIIWNLDLLPFRIAHLCTFSLQSPDTALTAPLSFPPIILTPSYNGFWMLSSYYSSANLRAPRFRATKHEFISVVFLSCKRVMLEFYQAKSYSGSLLPSMFYGLSGCVQPYLSHGLPGYSTSAIRTC